MSYLGRLSGAPYFRRHLHGDAFGCTEAMGQGTRCWIHQELGNVRQRVHGASVQHPAVQREVPNSDFQVAVTQGVCGYPFDFTIKHTTVGNPADSRASLPYFLVLAWYAVCSDGTPTAKGRTQKITRNVKYETKRTHTT